MNHSTEEKPATIEPLGAASQNLRFDAVAGLLVFLIALPLCLGISGASGFPAINGVFTAIAGGIICSFLSNSALTIKGPAAGMIAIVLGAATEFAGLAGVKIDNTDPTVYLQYLPMVAGVAVISGVLQMLFGLFKAGSLADFFPTAVIHGLLASIGLIIIGKQLYPLMGLKPNGSLEAYEAYLELPIHIPHIAWQAAIIGLASLLLLFVYPSLKKKISICNVVPAQLIILAIAIPVSGVLYRGFDGMKRAYSISHHGEPAVQEVKSLVVKVPPSASQLPSSFIYPNFSKVGTVTFWKWVIMFTLVGSLESLLSAKAVDVLDPWKRKTNLNRDLLAIGAANTAVACVGGLPMISEIVRSSANRDYGARSHWSNFFHGLFLLLSICLLPFLLNQIPVTALAAMLVYAGCRLAHYKEFLHMLHVGKEQLIVFLATIIGVLATDLLIGVGIGILVKFVIHLTRGVKVTDFFSAPVDIESQGRTQIVKLRGSLVFTNWLILKKKLSSLPKDSNIIIDCSNAIFVDHTSMSRLAELEKELEAKGRELTVRGLDKHEALSLDRLAARQLRYRA